MYLPDQSSSPSCLSCLRREILLRLKQKDLELQTSERIIVPQTVTFDFVTWSIKSLFIFAKAFNAFFLWQ